MHFKMLQIKKKSCFITVLNRGESQPTFGGVDFLCFGDGTNLGHGFISWYLQEAVLKNIC